MSTAILPHAQGPQAAPPLPGSNRTRVASFYFERDHNGKGPCVVVLVGSSWTKFLRSRVGVTRAPFFERAALAHEPDKLKDGQPFAWVYRKPDQMLLDEARWLSAQRLAELTLAFEAERTVAVSSAAPACTGEPARCLSV